MPADEIRIAMWSGPRNISTAMMRAWGSRADTAVCDEPFYAAWLARTGAPHPGRDEVLAAHETDPDRVIAWITGAIPHGRAIWYQKHMAHHLPPGFEGDWLRRFRHALLLREPRLMLASLVRFVKDPAVEETGLPQQLALLELIRRQTGRVPPIVEARELLADPEPALELLCADLGVPYDPAMLSWPAGRRSSDGAWAEHWYASVEASTGFRSPRDEAAAIPHGLERLLRECEEIHAEILAARPPAR